MAGEKTEQTDSPPIPEDLTGLIRVELRLAWPRQAVIDLLRLQDMLRAADREGRIAPTDEDLAYIRATYPLAAHDTLIDLFDQVPSLGLRLVGERGGEFLLADDEGIFSPFGAAIAMRAVMRAHRIREAALVSYRIVDPDTGTMLCGGPGSFVVSASGLRHRYPPDVQRSLVEEFGDIDDDRL